MERKLTLAEAQARYVHRYTIEHIPQWALNPAPKTEGGEPTYYAPQFRSDQEWYDLALFPGEPGYPGTPRATHCHSGTPTWPLGQWLKAPLRKLDDTDLALLVVRNAETALSRRIRDGEVHDLLCDNIPWWSITYAKEVADRVNIHRGD